MPVGDELIVRRVGQDFIEVQCDDVIAAAGSDPLEIGEVGATQVDRVGAAEDRIEGVEADAAVELKV